MAQLPDLNIGWQDVDPGPPPRSDELNRPPIVSDPADLVTAHQQWRQRVEQDEARLAGAHAQAPIWFPVPKTARHKIVPILGGTPSAWNLLIAGLIVAGSDAGFTNIRVVNLTQWPVFDALEAIGQRARRMGLRFDTVSASGSSVDLFANRELDDLASFIVDVLRVVSDPQGRRDSAREKADLVAIGNLLDPPVDIVKLTEALDTVLGQVATSQATPFTSQEVRNLRDFHARVVSQRRQTADRLDGLHADLRELVNYRRSATRPARQMGVQPLRVRALDLDASHGIHEFEMGREILARGVARAFGRAGAGPELLIIAGADKLAAEVLDSVTGSAEHLDKQLVLMFAEVTTLAQRAMGAAGSDYVIFMRLANADDAEVASRHLGKEFTFVVNGISIAKGQTEEWNQSYGTSNSVADTRGRHSGSSGGYGAGGFNFGRSFGSNVSRSFTTGQSETKGTSTATSTTSTTSSARVHEYVIEPEEFQRLEEDRMLVVDGKRAILASCDYRLRNHALASKAPLAIP